jgi:hypothetical protein
MVVMTTAYQGRAWPSFDPALFVGAFVLYTLAMPLGLDRVESAPRVAAALTLDMRVGAAPLALFATRLGELLPMGDVGLRANLVSALLTALAVTLVGRLCLQTVILLRPPARARHDLRDFLHEPVAALGAAGVFALSLSTFDIGVGAGSAAATLVVLSGGLLAGHRLMHDSHAHRVGFALSGLAGVCGGVDAVAAPLLWPAFIGLTLWALRRGSRWPLMAPLAFVMGWGAAVLTGVAAAKVPLPPAQFLPGLSTLRALSSSGIGRVGLELADEMGVVGVLVGGIGCVVLATRATLLTAWLFLTGFTALLFALAAQRAVGWLAVEEAARAALPVAIAVGCAFAGAGLVHVASRLGRARMAASSALVVIMLLSPALDKRPAMESARSGLPTHLLDRALGRAEIRATVFPGSEPMAGLFRLARALGLRPDLELSLPEVEGTSR